MGEGRLICMLRVRQYGRETMVCHNQAVQLSKQQRERYQQWVMGKFNKARLVGLLPVCRVQALVCFGSPRLTSVPSFVS